MKTFRSLLTLALPLGLVAANVALAQTADAPRGPRGGHRPPPHPIVRALDTDRDHALSAAELATATASLRALDTNADGALSADELRPARPERPADAPARPAGSTRPERPERSDRSDRARPLDPVMLALDANADGALSAAELANATASLRALDANADGALTRDEFGPVDGPRRPRKQ